MGDASVMDNWFFAGVMIGTVIVLAVLWLLMH
jgi:hypothetical protein